MRALNGSQPIAAIVLAAGASRRLGRPKQTLVLGGETLLERAVRVATQAGLSPIIAVIADESLVSGLQASGAIAILNLNATEGIASSIRAGVSQAQQRGCAGVVLMTCDQVAVHPEHLRQLCEQPDNPTGSAYAGKIGIPAYFPASSFAALLQLQGDTGARDLLRDARSIPTEALSCDIDTEADIAHAKALLDP